MLLLHHDPDENGSPSPELGERRLARQAVALAKAGAPGRTRTDEYGVTNPAL